MSTNAVPETTMISEDQVDPQLMADFEEFMAHKMAASTHGRPAANVDSGERTAVKSKKAINCEKARAKRTEYAALRKEVEFLRELIKQRNLTELPKQEKIIPPTPHQIPPPPEQAVRQPVRREMFFNFD